jgi:hypothetical protein
VAPFGKNGTIVLDTPLIDNLDLELLVRVRETGGGGVMSVTMSSAFSRPFERSDVSLAMALCVSVLSSSRSCACCCRTATAVAAILASNAPKMMFPLSLAEMGGDVMGEVGVEEVVGSGGMEEGTRVKCAISGVTPWGGADRGGDEALRR